MEYRQIETGTKLELELYNSNYEKVCSGLVSQFESYDETSNMMEIHVPFTQGKIYTIHTGAELDVIFLKEKDTYMFKAVVTGRKNTEPIPMLWVKPVSQIEKIERRSFFRMECKLPVRYHIIGSTEEKDTEEIQMLDCYTRDISGGGVCLVTEEAYEPGTKIRASLKIGKQIGFIGTVVRSVQIREKGKILYEIGVEYKQIENRDREKIISYIFEKQREKIRKGWIMP